jgi:hypothetical protein
MPGEILEISASSLTDEKLHTLISEKRSFKVTSVANISEVVAQVEPKIEAAGLKVRVYTEYRTAALAGEALIGGLGALAAVGIAAHNLATWDPDYEIGKNKLSDSVTVTYKK